MKEINEIIPGIVCFFCLEVLSGCQPREGESKKSIAIVLTRRNRDWSFTGPGVAGISGIGE